MSRFFQKTFVLFSLFSFTITPYTSLALDFDYPDPAEIMQEFEQRYHLNTGAIQNLSEGLNVSDRKGTAPEVMLFFSPSNPVPGQEITAKATPLYFQNDTNRLYYTWYIQRKDCDMDDSVDSDKRYCDSDNDGDVDENDWKIEAMRILANGGFTPTGDTYRGGQPSDSDGYRATWGGDGNERILERCSIQDFSSGVVYEFADGSSRVDFGCGRNTVARCVRDDVTLTCSDSESLFSEDVADTTYSVCQNTGQTPGCSNSKVSCPSGTTARCVPSTFSTPSCDDNPINESSCSSFGTAIGSCSRNADDFVSNGCQHLFPQAPGHALGNDDFGISEERFWQTDPQDPDTADTGYGDEANLVGLGQTEFTWNYEVGDKVGVAVEGVSMIPTKHDNRSYAIMWALPKNDCPIENASSYTKTVRGYDVRIPTTTTNINNCLERNLVDPREGGQTGKLDVSLSYAPQTVYNDASGDGFGSILNVTSSVSNTGTPTNLLKYDWNVEVSRDGTFNPRGFSNDPNRDATGGWMDITEYLRDKKLISFTAGNGVTELAIRLNLNESINNVSLASLFPGDAGYLRVKARVSEYIDVDQKSRESLAMIVIPVVSTDRYITASTISVGSDGRLSPGTRICEEEMNLDASSEDFNPLGLGRNVCLVSKNEIIALGASNSSGFSDFRWTVNNEPLVCTNSLSNTCSDAQSQVTNFLPVTGDPGEGYSVTLNATNAQTGKKVSLSRYFQIIEPSVRIVSNDPAVAWQKYLGYHKGLDGYAYENTSATQYETFAGSDATFTVEFFPSWIKDRSQWQWSVNGVSFGDTNQESISGSLTGNPGDIYTLQVNGESEENTAIRKALRDYWGVSVFDSGRHALNTSIDVQLVQGAQTATLDSPQAFFATVAKNAPKQIIFFAQMLLSLFTVIALMAIIFALGASGNPGRK